MIRPALRAVFPCLLCVAANAADAAEFTLATGPALLQAMRPRTTAVTEVEPSLGATLLGIPERFEPQVGVRAREAWTLGIGGRYTRDRHWYWALDLGIPPRIEVDGYGEAAPPGAVGGSFRLDLSDPSINPLASQRQWSPVAGLEWRAFEPDAALRPFVSLGATYTWFTDARLNPAFERALDERYGQPLANGAGKPGPTRSRLEIDSLWAPVAGAGFHYAAGRHASLALGAAWVPLRVDATLTMRANDGTLLATTRTRSRAHGVVIALVAGWRWTPG